MNQKKYQKALARVIKKERKKRKLSQEALAKRCGLSWGYFVPVERGERNVTLGSILKIARGLEVSAGELLTKAGI